MKHLIRTLARNTNASSPSSKSREKSIINILRKALITSFSTVICASLVGISTLPVLVKPVLAQNTLADFSVLPESIVGNIAANPNILIILDSSGSMGSFVASQQVGTVRDGYVVDPVTNKEYLLDIGGGTHNDHSSSFSNSFQVRQAIRNVLNAPEFRGLVNVGLMTFGVSDECTYSPADNNDPDTIGAGQGYRYSCRGISDQDRNTADQTNTTGIGALRANLDVLEGDHLDTLLRLLGPEPSISIDQPEMQITDANGNTRIRPAENNIGSFNGRPVVRLPDNVSTEAPINNVLHPFLNADPSERVLTGREFPVIVNPRRSFINRTPIAGTLDSAFRYLLRNDTAVDERTENGNLNDVFGDGLIDREVALPQIQDLVQYPTADQCEGDFIVILLTDGAPTQLSPGLDELASGSGDINTSTDESAAEAAAARLRTRGLTTSTDQAAINAAQTTLIDQNQNPIDIHVIGFNLADLDTADDIARIGGTENAIASATTEQVEAAFSAIFNDALGEGGSRSSLSVVAPSSSALGSFVQPGFVPLLTFDEDENDDIPAVQVSWTGQLANFFIDEFGNFREDSNQNNNLDEDDFGFLLNFDEGTQLTHVTKFRVDSSDGSAIPGSVVGVANANNTINTDPEVAFDEYIQVSDLVPIWSAQERLDALPDSNRATRNNRGYNNLPGDDGARFIITSLDGSTTFPFDYARRLGRADRIDPTEIGLFDLPFDDDISIDDQNFALRDLLHFIRGEENENFRNRIITDENGIERELLLGDIVHSTPIQVEEPLLPPAMGNSADVTASFRPYRERYTDRRRMVYVGANDGMLHAFNGGFWNGLDEDDEIDDGVELEVTRTPEDGNATSFELGEEMWAYVPRSVFPHLKFLSDPNYLSGNHVAFVDGSIAAYEVKLFDNASGNCAVGIADDAEAASNCRYVNGWGTILVSGLRFGGAPYTGDLDNDPTTPDETTATSFLIFDVTDPESPPELIAEISNPEFNLGTVAPALIRTSVEPGTNSPEIEYSLVFGSGPIDLQSATVQDNSSPQLFVYELSSDSVEQVGGGMTVSSDLTNTFIGGIAAADWDGDDVDDAIYFGTVGGTNAIPTGQLYRGILGSNGSITSQFLIDAGGALEQAPVIPGDQLVREDKYILFGTGRSYVPDDLRQTYDNTNIFAGVIEDIRDINSNPITFGDTEISASVRSGDIRDTNFDGNSNTSIAADVFTGEVPNGNTDATTRTDLIQQFGPSSSNSMYHGWVFDLPAGTSRMSAAPFTFEELAFFTDFEPQLLETAQANAAEGETICLPPGTGFLTIFDYRIGVVPAIERFILSDEVLLPPEQRPLTDAPNRLAVSGSLLAGGSVLVLGDNQDGTTDVRIKLPGGDQDVAELAGTIFGPISDFGRSAWREIPIPEDSEL